MLSEAYVRHDANLPEVVGPQAQKQFMQGILAAFSGLTLEEQAMVAEGGVVALRLIISGRHVGEFMGIPATDLSVSFQSQEFYRVDGALLAEQWVTMDVLGLLQQLGPSQGTDAMSRRCHSTVEEGRQSPTPGTRPAFCSSILEIPMLRLGQQASAPWGNSRRNARRPG
jgi:predicted ester cyclase